MAASRWAFRTSGLTLFLAWRSSVSLSALDLSHGTLLVLSSVEDGPRHLSRVL